MAQQTTHEIGWIGLGSMGIGMSKNLQKQLATHDKALRYFNRTLSRGEPLQRLGGIPCSSVADLVHESDIVFISMSDDEALEMVIDSILASGNVKGKIIVDTTTVHPNTSKAVNHKLGKKGAIFISAPVFGASPVAEAGQLLMGLGGPPDAITVISPFLKGVMARDVIQVSSEPDKATLLKTTGNFITASLQETLSEAHVFAEKTGLGCDVVEQLVEKNYGKYAYSVSQRITSGAYCPAFGQAPASSIDLAIKDIGHGISCAKDVGTKLQVAELALEHLKRAKVYADQLSFQSDGEDKRHLDSCSMYGVVRLDAGLEFESQMVKDRDAASKSGS